MAEVEVEGLHGPTPRYPVNEVADALLRIADMLEVRMLMMYGPDDVKDPEGPIATYLFALGEQWKARLTPGAEE